MCFCVCKQRKESRNSNFSHKFPSIARCMVRSRKDNPIYRVESAFLNFEVFLSIFQCFRVSYSKNITTWSVGFNIDPSLFLQGCKGHPLICRLPHQNYPRSVQRGNKLLSQKRLPTAEREVLSAQPEPPGTLANRQRWCSCRCVRLWVALADTLLHTGVVAWPQLGTEKGRPAQHWNPVPVSDCSYTLLLVSHV